MTMPFVADALHLDGPSQPQTHAGKGSLQLHRTTIFAIAWVLTLLTSGGLCFGFGPFYSRLVKEHQWHELCPDNTTSVCSAQEVQLQTVYSTGILMTVLGQTVFGLLLDTIGPRYMTLVAYVFSIAGNVCLAVGDSRDGTDGLLVAGYALIGFGGMRILYASLQLSTLFNEPALYTSLLVAAYSFSGYIFVLLELDVARQSFFVGYALLVAASMVLAYAVFPVHHILTQSPTVTTPGFAVVRSHVDRPKLDQLWVGLKRQVKRRDYWVYVSLGSMLFLVVIFGGGAMPSIIAASRVPANDSQHDNHDLQRVYTNYLYPLISNSSFLFSPLAGYLVVHFGFRKTFYTTIGIFALLCGSFMLPSLPAQNATFVLMAAANAFLTTMQYVYIMTCFPHELYGVLSGVTTTLVFVYGLLSYPLMALAQYSFDGNNTYVFLILLGTTVAAIFLVPFAREEAECFDADLHLDLLEHASRIEQAQV
ncbi:hypothetical protein H257_11603 [Aphanomyces astaci]|uniref:Major facilitator superfamily (MFS) profile domain-containing protein n=1 Tax=Aphanomyces astaci TaxID=112090 RepID=W4G2G4_APHAT|nr:hypothetical protein H257_11603 [Aphanomyces astaci]ETV73471.1 hypothetical protein H257_11603 [Aphanomyces astaci]|eukprot:XP_009836897.1 hypothetical protein H257_11603 [Aphanomyces astaci]